MTLLTTPRGRFRLISFAEGVSYLVLLGIAMPMKYLGGDTVAVPLLGRIHGGLFVLFAIALVQVASVERWSRRAIGTAMIAALLPLGAFWLERAIRRGRFPPAT